MGFGAGNGSLNDGRIPNFRGVRVHASTGYNAVEGNRRASRNRLVSDLPPFRFATFASRCLEPEREPGAHAEAALLSAARGTGSSGAGSAKRGERGQAVVGGQGLVEAAARRMGVPPALLAAAAARCATLVQPPVVVVRPSHHHPPTDL